MKTQPKQSERLDAVAVRVSTTAQENEAQRANIERGLREREVYIPADYWFTDTRSRFKPQKGPDFAKLMALVKAGRVQRVFIESQDRGGLGRGSKIFSYLDTFREHRTKLIDLTTGRDLTSTELADELQVYIQAKKDEMELLDTTRRSLRSKLHKMTDKGSWPGGPPPLGYDKAYYHKDGRLLWVFHHTALSHGNQFFPDAAGKLQPGPTDITPPRNDKDNVVKLRPDPTRRKIIEDIFRWWTTETVSRREIAHRLTKRGDRMYTAPWTHTNVTTVLRNPAYVGIVSYGRSSRAELQRFDKSNKVTQIKEGEAVAKTRPLADCPQKEDAHPAIIDRKTWDAAQAKLDSNTRASFAPREAEYYLKGLLVCGHCGKALTPSSSRKRATEGGKQYRKYLCSSYTRGQATGATADKCKAYSISTDEAERVINSKLAEIGAHATLNRDGRAALETETHLLGTQADELRAKLHQIVEEGLTGYVEELRTVYRMKGADLDALAWAVDIALLNPPEVSKRVRVEGGSKPVSVADVRKAIEKIEAKRVKAAGAKLAELEAEHKALTLTWAKATERMQSVLKAELSKLETELREWEQRTVPLTAQIDQYDRDIAERVNRIAEVQAEWPKMELRQKGEALRGIFARIVLKWGADRKAKITRYPLLVDQIGWEFTSGAASQMEQGY